MLRAKRDLIFHLPSTNSDIQGCPLIWRYIPFSGANGDVLHIFWCTWRCTAHFLVHLEHCWLAHWCGWRRTAHFFTQMEMLESYLVFHQNFDFGGISRRLLGNNRNGYRQHRRPKGGRGGFWVPVYFWLSVRACFWGRKCGNLNRRWSINGRHLMVTFDRPPWSPAREPPGEPRNPSGPKKDGSRLDFGTRCDILHFGSRLAFE